MTRSRVWRAMAVVLAGGVLFQVGGCATTFAPIVLSLLESVVLSGLTGSAVGGL